MTKQIANEPERAGERVPGTLSYFGEASRYQVFAIYTRFDAVQWFVTDEAIPDELTGSPSVICQAASKGDALLAVTIFPERVREMFAAEASPELYETKIEQFGDIFVLFYFDGFAWVSIGAPFYTSRKDALIDRALVMHETMNP